MTVFRQPLVSMEVERPAPPKKAFALDEDYSPRFTQLLDGPLDGPLGEIVPAGGTGRSRFGFLLSGGRTPRSQRRLPAMANWNRLASPRREKIRQGLSQKEKDAAQSSRVGWLFRQNDLRYIRGVLTPECEMR